MAWQVDPRIADSVVNMSSNGTAAHYIRAIALAKGAGVAAEPEAQLTVPVHDLLISIAKEFSLGELHLLREAQLKGVVPDFAALLDGRPCGWVELKAPGHTLDGDKWRGREKKQWGLLAELDSLIVTNGEEATLYVIGEPIATASLPMGDALDWDSAPLVSLLRLFSSARPTTITRVSQLASRLAPLAGMLRDRISAGLTAETRREPVVNAKVAWNTHVHDSATDAQFATDLAQVIAYSLAIAALRGGADKDKDSYITLTEARNALRGPNDMLAASLGPAIEVPGLLAELRQEIAAIERLASVVDAPAIARSNDSRGEPWLWFYEDFLAKYDPEARKQAGVYYTPSDVVGAQVRLVDYILTEVFDKPLSFGDPNVVTLDPATGSGTYPLTVLARAAEVATAERGEAGPQQVAASLAKNLIAFELMPGPYAVAHLRIGQRLAELARTPEPPSHVRVYLTDTLDDPAPEAPMLGFWGDVAVLAQERSRAAEVKRDQPVTTVIGNPPYARRTSKSGGGWVVHPQTGRALFADVIEPAQQAGVVFSAMRSLYDDYAYFWRWAIWKAFEQNDDRPAIVSFITSSTWLKGPAFIGLRRLARKHADEMWIIDLGGGNRGAVKDENVFSIQTAVAIVTIYRRGRSAPEPAVVYYRQVTGTSSEKLKALQYVTAPAASPEAWERLDVPADAILLPSTSDEAWEEMPALTDLLPWQQPGANFARSWVVSPSKKVLEARWRELMNRENATSRAEAFVTPKAGRTIHTKVVGLSKLSELTRDAPHRPIVPLAYRSFDRQFTFEDPRLAKTESPSLWAGRSNTQLFLVSMPTNPLGTGPALVVTTAVPDFHHFAGRGGKDVLPLYRDATTEHPNLASSLLGTLTSRYGRPCSPEDVAAYVFAIMAHPGYQQRFAHALRTPGPRIPLTSDPELFAEAVDLGSHLLWLQTFAERYRDVDSGRGSRLPNIEGIGWTHSVTSIPEDMDAVTYDSDTRTLHIADGVVSGVAPEVWEFSVSGLQVIPRWIGSRTRKGVGRASTPRYATPLDRIRPSEWEDVWNGDLLNLVKALTKTTTIWPQQDALLARIVSGPLLTSVDLPEPTSGERSVPRA